MSSDSSGNGRDIAAVEHEARALVDRRRYAQARAAIGRGLKDFPDSIELQYLAAFIDYAEDRQDSAMQGVDTVLVQEPHHYGARTLRARLLEDARRLPEAETVWIDLLREYPESADCYAGYGELMLKTLNLDKAERLAKEGLRHSPDHAESLYLAAMIDLIRNRRGTDNEPLRRMLRQHPEQVRSAIALAAALSDRGDHRGALRIAQELLRNQPDSPHILAYVRALKTQTHWSLLPLYPMQRWGWTGAIVVTALGITALHLSERSLPPSVSGPLTWLWLGYVIYSWTWPRLLRRWI